MAGRLRSDSSWSWTFRIACVTLHHGDVVPFVSLSEGWRVRATGRIRFIMAGRLRSDSSWSWTFRIACVTLYDGDVVPLTSQTLAHAILSLRTFQALCLTVFLFEPLPLVYHWAFYVFILPIVFFRVQPQKSLIVQKDIGSFDKHNYFDVSTICNTVNVGQLQWKKTGESWKSKFRRSGPLWLRSLFDCYRPSLVPNKAHYRKTPLKKYLIVTIICGYKILRFGDSDDFASINFCDFTKLS